MNIGGSPTPRISYNGSWLARSGVYAGNWHDISTRKLFPLHMDSATFHSSTSSMLEALTSKQLPGMEGSLSARSGKSQGAIPFRPASALERQDIQQARSRRTQLLAERHRGRHKEEQERWARKLAFSAAQVRILRRNFAQFCDDDDSVLGTIDVDDLLSLTFGGADADFHGIIGIDDAALDDGWNQHRSLRRKTFRRLVDSASTNGRLTFAQFLRVIREMSKLVEAGSLAQTMAVASKRRTGSKQTVSRGDKRPTSAIIPNATRVKEREAKIQQAQSRKAQLLLAKRRNRIEQYLRRRGWKGNRAELDELVQEQQTPNARATRAHTSSESTNAGKSARRARRRRPMEAQEDDALPSDSAGKSIHSGVVDAETVSRHSTPHVHAAEFNFYSALDFHLLTRTKRQRPKGKPRRRRSPRRARFRPRCST